MKKILRIIGFSFVIFLGACSIINPGKHDAYSKKMKNVADKLGFTENYHPQYFNSPAPYKNVINNNQFHIDSKIFNQTNSPVLETPVNIAWDVHIGVDENGKEVPPDYAIVLLPGSGGSYIQFSEMVYDLEVATGQKIVFYMMDHRGQGFSTWFNPNNREGFNGLYVDEFVNYRKDLKFFYDTIVMPRILNLELKYNKKIPVFVFGHSLGGGIAAEYLEQFPKDFDGAILSSPAIKALDWLNRSLAYVGVFGIIKHGGGAEYVPFGDDIHEELPFTSIFCNTSSVKRWYYWQKISDPDYYDNKMLVHPNSGGEVIRMSFPTFWWTYQLIVGTDPISKPENAGKISVPYIIFCAEKENLISKKALNEFLLNTPKGLGQFIFLLGSKHDIMLEKDETRNEFIKEIAEFIKDNGEKGQIHKRPTDQKVKVIISQNSDKTENSDI